MKQAEQMVLDIGKQYKLEVPPKALVKDIPVSMQQRVEILKALYLGADLLIMDEPTAVLTPQEIVKLFETLVELRNAGKSIILITHKLNEIMQITDEIMVLRLGKVTGHVKTSETDERRIAEMMVGRQLSEQKEKKVVDQSQVALEAERLEYVDKWGVKAVDDISFTLHKGEILGIAGLVGSKRTEIVETIFGMREKASGKITIKGKEVKNHNPNEAIANGFALVTEERRATGIYGMLDINFNSTISNLDRYKGKHPLLALLNDKGMKEDTQWVIDSMHVKTPSQNTSIGSLSGGNQQKVILGRWLLTEPDVLMLDEPTRGIDVLAKYEIYQLMIELAKKDKGIIMISSEMPELLGVTDRILVMSNGRVAGIVKTSETTQEEIMTLSAKYL